MHSTDLPPDGGDPVLVAEERVHGDRVLDDQGRDGDEGQHQHVQDEELLAIGGGGVNVIAANPPHSVLHTLRIKSAWLFDEVSTSYIISHFHGVVIGVGVDGGVHPPNGSRVHPPHALLPRLLDHLLLLASHRHLLDAVHDVKVIFSK